jgi:hypothetical protein
MYPIFFHRSSKIGRERDLIGEDVGTNNLHSHKIKKRRRLLRQENEEHLQRHILDRDLIHSKKQQIEESQVITNHPSPQPIRSSLLFNPSVANLLDSWGLNLAIEPVEPPQVLDPKILEVVASWGGTSPIPAPIYPILEPALGKQFEQGRIPSSKLSYSSVDDIVKSWYAKANESLSLGTIDGSDREKGLGEGMKGVKGKMSKGQTDDASVSIFPSPSVLTYFPKSKELEKRPKGMANMMKGQTFVPVTVSPSPSMSTTFPSSIYYGKGMRGMSKTQTNTPSTSTSVPTTTAAPSRQSKGKMSLSKSPTSVPQLMPLAPVVLSPSTVQTDNPTVAPFPPISSPPVKAGKGMSSMMGTMGGSSNSKGKGMSKGTNTPTKQISLPPAPSIPPPSIPNTTPVGTPILSAPNILPTPPILSPNPPVPLNNPVSTPILFPFTPFLPIQPTPSNTPVTTPNLTPVSTPNKSPAAPLPAVPTITTPNMAPLAVAPLLTPVTPPILVPTPTAPIASPTQTVPTMTPPTQAPLTTPVAPLEPTTGNQVAATPYQVLYAPTTGPISAADFTSAIDVTCAHVEQAIMDVIAMSPFLVVNDISCRSVSTATAPTTISFETNVVFDPSSTIVLMTKDIDGIIQTSFRIPEVNTLISSLNMLPSNNPFSATAMVTYS